MRGEVKWFSIDKGYGFITSSEGADHYFHVSDVSGVVLPKLGDVVLFDAGTNKRGLFATNISIIVPSTEETDKLECKSCTRKIIPRIIVDSGVATHSICPFCGRKVKDFTILGAWFDKLGDNISNEFSSNPKAFKVVLVVFILLLLLLSVR